MAGEHKRYTISVPPELEADLKRIKTEWYGRITQNAMLRDLIRRGLDTLPYTDEPEQNGDN